MSIEFCEFTELASLFQHLSNFLVKDRQYEFQNILDLFGWIVFNE